MKAAPEPGPAGRQKKQYITKIKGGKNVHNDIYFISLFFVITLLYFFCGITFLYCLYYFVLYFLLLVILFLVFWHKTTKRQRGFFKFVVLEKHREWFNDMF